MNLIEHVSLLTLIMAAMLIWVSVKAIWGVLRLNRTFELNPDPLLYPANCKPELCLDPAGFIRFITPRLWGFGLLGAALSVFLVLREALGWFEGPLGWAAGLVPLGLFLLIFGWYIIFINKAARRFWQAKGGRHENCHS